MHVVEISHLTKDYGDGKGVFDISFTINKGEVLGFLGPNGAGKSTTIRHLLGFLKPQDGGARIQGMDCWKQPKDIQNVIGYLPGEIAYPNDMNGDAFIAMIAHLRKMQDMSYANELKAFFELDASGDLKRMSKGMKQKIGIVCAFMHNPDILILDEPTSGLDPLMQNRFVELIEKEKAKGKTILMSSHMFEEVERTCDRICIIKGGKILSEIDAEEFRHIRLKSFKMEFKKETDYRAFQKASFTIEDQQDQLLQLTCSLHDEDINTLIRTLAQFDLVYLKEQKHTLEEYFMQFYGGEQNDQSCIIETNHPF